MSWEFVAGFFQIVLIDLSLSGDNAIVIGMAAASIPRNRRKRALIIGGGCAILLRIALTAGATTLMKITLISAIAGGVLFWVAWKLLKMDVAEEEEKEKAKAKEAKTFRQAILVILLADFMMSLDNVLAVAGAAHGSYLLLIIGLITSMPLLITTGGLISRLIDRFKWLPFVGAAVISFTGMRMILEDKFIEPRLEISSTMIITISVVVGVLVPIIIVLINRRKARLAAANDDASSASGVALTPNNPKGKKKVGSKNT
jgi:YjbE family integral membrane protein